MNDNFLYTLKDNLLGVCIIRAAADTLGRVYHDTWVMLGVNRFYRGLPLPTPPKRGCL